jgi:hypothetical protein
MTKGKKKAGALLLLLLLGGGLLLMGKSAEAKTVDPPLPEPPPKGDGDVLATPTPVVIPADAPAKPPEKSLYQLIQDAYPTTAELSWMNLPAALLALGTVESKLTPGAQGDYVNGLPTSFGIWQVHQPTWASTAGAFPVGASAATEVAYIKPLVDDLTSALVAVHAGNHPDGVDPALVSSLIWEFGSTRVKNWAKKNPSLTQDSFRSYFQSATGNSVDKFYPKASGFADRQSKMEDAYNSAVSNA